MKQIKLVLPLKFITPIIEIKQRKHSIHVTGKAAFFSLIWVLNSLLECFGWMYCSIYYIFTIIRVGHYQKQDIYIPDTATLKCLFNKLFPQKVKYYQSRKRMKIQVTVSYKKQHNYALGWDGLITQIMRHLCQGFVKCIP